MNLWQPYLIAIVIGLLVGIEREKAHPDKKTMGVRTFLLISLLGAIAGGLQNLWLSTLLMAFTLGLILISYFTQTNSKIKTTDRGLTTEFAAGIIFCLGYAAHQSPALSALIGPIVAMILFSKTSLHRFTRNLKHSELEAALLLLLGGVAVINLAPDAVVDPWGVFNPRKFGYLVMALATLEFSSYVLAKIIGEKKGLLLIGFLGGLVSSTAVLISSAKQANTAPDTWRSLLCSTLVAKLAALIELLFIVGLITPKLLLRIAPGIATGILIAGIALFFIAQKMGEQNAELKLQSPLDWRGVLRLAFMLSGVLAAISLAQFWLGDSGTFVASFLTGLFELHGASLATATMYNQAKLTIEIASLSILLAVGASLLAKVCISWIVTRSVFSRALTVIFIPLVLAIGLVTWLTL